jgi:hypothetical protein
LSHIVMDSILRHIALEEPWCLASTECRSSVLLW